MKNRQLSLFEQEQRADPTRTDVEIVQALCDRLLDAAEERPPVDVELLASMRGVTRVEHHEQPFAGMIAPDGEGLVVHVRASDSSRRQRFTILHEAAHTFLAGFADTPQFRCEPPGAKTRTEGLCDIAASELLLPRRYFERDLAHAAFGLDAIEELADAYEASVEATALRTVDLSPEPAILLVFRVGHKPSERGRETECEPKLRLAYAHKDAAWPWPFMRRDKSVESSTPFARAYDGEIVDEVGDLGPLAAHDAGLVEISARRYGYERVLALVRRAAPSRRRL
jgi:hypothetical protein